MSWSNGGWNKKHALSGSRKLLKRQGSALTVIVILSKRLDGVALQLVGSLVARSRSACKKPGEKLRTSRYAKSVKMHGFKTAARPERSAPSTPRVSDVFNV